MTKQVAPVLSDEEIKHKVQAILDFGINVDDEILKLIQQAKAEIAREMLQDMREHIYWPIPMFEAKWKSKYMEGK